MVFNRFEIVMGLLKEALHGVKPPLRSQLSQDGRLPCLEIIILFYGCFEPFQS